MALQGPSAGGRALGAAHAGSGRACAEGQEAGHRATGAARRWREHGRRGPGVGGGGVGGRWLRRGHGAGGGAWEADDGVRTLEAGGMACVRECLGACVCAGEEQFCWM